MKSYSRILLFMLCLGLTNISLRAACPPGCTACTGSSGPNCTMCAVNYYYNNIYRSCDPACAANIKAQNTSFGPSGVCDYQEVQSRAQEIYDIAANLASSALIAIILIPILTSSLFTILSILLILRRKRMKKALLEKTQVASADHSVIIEDKEPHQLKNNKDAKDQDVKNDL